MMGSLRRIWEARIFPWNAGTVVVRCRDVGDLEKQCYEKKGTKVKERTVTTNFGKRQSLPWKKGNKALRREAMVNKVKAHEAEAEEEEVQEEEDGAYYVEDENIDGDLFEKEYDVYMMNFKDQGEFIV
jgi:hypothetical protein